MKNIAFTLVVEEDNLPWFIARCKKDRKKPVDKIKGLRTLRRRAKVAKRMIKFIEGIPK
jgi:hypothetical protein